MKDFPTQSAFSLESMMEFWRPGRHDDNKFAYVTFDEPYTLLELKYMDVLCQILAKPQWWVKCQDTTILSRWKAESTLSDHDFAFLVRELEHYIQQCRLDVVASSPASTDDRPLIIPLPVHGVFMTDHVVGSDLLRSIQTLTVKLENQARARGDFHPHSNNQVLDIVHPSLYCAVNGRTRLSTSTAAVVGDHVLAWPASKVYDVSNKFQWLPTPIHVDASGSVSWQAYINGIDPADHVALYSALESLFATMVPMFEQCLAAVDSQPPHRMQNIDMSAVMPKNRRECAEEAFRALQRETNPNITDEDLSEMDDGLDEFTDDFDESQVPLFLPTLPTDTDGCWAAYPAVDLKGKNLQVIVKVASIELTPDKPRYPGGSWHVEGMTHESIAATGILYYDCDNITTSKLSFRHVYDPYYEFDYEQDEHTAISAVYGITREGCDNTQVVGHVVAATGRCVVFPNFLQHCVAPFELADPTRNGHRKIVCFFLINPDHSILSTANVPPQQESWTRPRMDSAFAGTLPDEALDAIRTMSGVMSHAQAKEYMLELMEERKNSSVFAQFLTEEVSLCEH
ncbi:hypothetical protein H310_02734 [Aphanomyces invadans]|uniref:DUF4246 domain-containing protein n=1 Tax=Aphanomyces invadans TaxID=157072 RepID=A0A024UJ85_9STRA|nr:hypothetical protein H310_02734 [Aphanomyces invadans]ETW06491.1 hypothetical protein H310_02734 [Aphanomyces invadans]|eukprot:XP_008864566.1 hypothetical protein H310_02734 [Aphanomyces invadans]